MITSFHFPGQTVTTPLTFPYKLYFLVFCLVPLLIQQPAVEGLSISLVLAATTGHTGKDLASTTQSKRTAPVVLWTILFLIYYGMALAFFIKYMTHHQLRRDHLPPFFFPGIVIYPISIDLKMYNLHLLLLK